ncbi:outer membrane protein assembly factor BamB [Actinoplanes octamycinicus]|uniref:Outer membrane protein assembly factor BamB n=1 Tax=Actinoplanes octamycinicus TaxID=135948 RepID=A0A7W7GS29_9ACTN|nr:PQQ-binding-like beta-propeller repeat protein [Actinoplanes octamycinicus]MBB4737186.1 outer membrane protein assembly factor BamB [Actinoplanes octamycinicus]GIE61994.1 hypothetical protein Aoc01nite_73960 [Actinoplanes octamycinicus]
MTVIDLGDLSVHPDEPPAPPPARRLPRRPAAALVALLCAVTLGAAATPDPPLVHEVWSVPAEQGDGLATTEDTVYVARATDGRTVLSAYELATGATRWTRDLPWVSGGGLLTFLAGDGMVQLADTPRGSIGDRPEAFYPSRATVVDAATGEVRWRTTGEVQHTTPEAVLLADRDDLGEITALRLAGARTGEIRWTRPVRRVIRLELDGSRIVTVTEAGEAAVYRYADGTPLARGRVAWNTDRDLGAQALIHDGRYVVTRTDPLGATVTAYRLTDLRPDWSLRTLRSSLISDCGPVLCLSRGADVAGLEPATGTTRWVLAGQGFVNRAGPDRLLAAGTDTDQPAQTLVDAATGRVIAGLGPGWPDGDLLIGNTTGSPVRTVLSRMDLVAGRSTPVGTVESIEGVYCSVTGRFLACRRPGRIVVTAVG